MAFSLLPATCSELSLKCYIAEKHKREKQHILRKTRAEQKSNSNVHSASSSDNDDYPSYDKKYRKQYEQYENQPMSFTLSQKESKKMLNTERHLDVTDDNDSEDDINTFSTSTKNHSDHKQWRESNESSSDLYEKFPHEKCHGEKYEQCHKQLLDEESISPKSPPSKKVCLETSKIDLECKDACKKNVDKSCLKSGKKLFKRETLLFRNNKNNC